MLVVRDAQMDALRRAADDAFAQSLVESIQAAFPALYARLGPHATRFFVRRGIARAEGLGVETERDLARWVMLVFTFGEAFDARPWAAPVFADRDLRGSPLVDRLYEALRNHEASA